MDRTTLALSYLVVFMIGFMTADTPVDLERQGNIDGSRSASSKIVAVSQGGQGTIGTVKVSIEPGDGRVLLDTNPFVETDIQFSAKTAKEVAEHVTGVSLDDRNVIYTFTIEGDYLGGPSAGAAMTVATIAAIRNRTVPNDTVVTGTIRPDGRIGQVGGVLEKTVTAGEHDMKTFYVPWTQDTITTYRQVVEERSYNGFRFQDIQYVPQTIDLNNITRQRYGMRTEGVKHISQITTDLW